MKTLITVYFKKEHNGKTTKFANQNRNVASKCFKTIEEAREFAQTVEVINVYNYVGNKIAL
jgi:hypothetical protein